MEPSNIANPRFYRCPTHLVLHTPTLLRHAWLLRFKSWNDHLGLRPASKGSSRSVVRHVPRISLRMSVFAKFVNSTMGLASSEPNRLKFQFAELRQFEVHTVYGQTQRRINVGNYREIFDDISPNNASKLRGSYSRCKRPGLDQGSRSGLWCGLFLRHVHVRFDCAGSYKTRDPMLTLIICPVNSFINSSCDMSMFTSTAEARTNCTSQSWDPAVFGYILAEKGSCGTFCAGSHRSAPQGSQALGLRHIHCKFSSVWALVAVLLHFFPRGPCMILHRSLDSTENLLEILVGSSPRGPCMRRLQMPCLRGASMKALVRGCWEVLVSRS